MDIPARARRLAKRLSALPEPAMRRSVMADFMRTRPLEEQVDMLAIVLRRGRAGGPPFHLALDAFVHALAAPECVPYERQCDLYACAKERGHEDLAQLFLSAVEGPQADERALGRALALRGRPLTLGERKQLARGGRRDLLERLLRDPDPSVIRLLLDNPKLTEPDVVLIAARRPTHPEIQREIFAARRWIARYRVKRTLVLNPYTPTDLAVRLLGFLTASDLAEVAADAELSTAVRTAARTLAAAG